MRKAKLLAPSSGLVMLAILSDDLPPGYRKPLAVLLLFLNEQVSTRGSIRTGTEGEVVAAALKAVESRRGTT